MALPILVFADTDTADIFGADMSTDIADIFWVDSNIDPKNIGITISYSIYLDC